jgi:hypothetical protein
MTDAMGTGTSDMARGGGTGRGAGIADRVKRTASTRLNVEKNRATDGLGSVAGAVRETTRMLRDDHHDTIARYAEDAAAQIERFSERLRNRDISELLRDLQRLAHRRPALFIGGAFVLGLVGARFFKASARDEDWSFDEDRFVMASRPDEYRSYAQASGVVPPSLREVSQIPDASDAMRQVRRGRS